MPTSKLTKTELRSEQYRLAQLQKYLPTLQLKKALLQAEINEAEAELSLFMTHFRNRVEKAKSFAPLLSGSDSFQLFSAIRIAEINERNENVAGVDLPLLEEVKFIPSNYSLYASPIWLESAIDTLQDLILYRERIRVGNERKRLLEKELREVSIRVNLFEKIMIPRSLRNIKKIKIFLGDQQLAAVAQAKVSKDKILQRKRAG